MEISEQAQELHAKAIIYDGHNDSFILHWARNEPMEIVGEWPQYHVDLPRLRAGGTTAFNCMVGCGDLHQAIELWDPIFQHVQNYPDDFLLALEPEDIERAKTEDKIGLVPQVECCAFMNRSLKILRVLYELGLRVAILTHGEPDPDGLRSPDISGRFCRPADRERARRDYLGLTEFGKAAVKEMNRLGIVVDLAHTKDAAYYEAIELSETPVVFSHGNCFALSPHWRNLTDDQLQALRDNGGVIGISCPRSFIAEDEKDRTFERLIDHIEYAFDLIGDDHVGYGSDFDGTTDPIPPDPTYQPQITQKLLDRGFSEETILKFWGGNFLRVMRAVREAAG